MSLISTLFRPLSLAVILSVLIGCSKPTSEPKVNPTPDPQEQEDPTPGPQEDPTPDPPAEKNYFKGNIKDVYVFCFDGFGIEMNIYYESDIEDITVTPSESWCKASVHNDDVQYINLYCCEEYRPTFNPDGSGGWLYAEPRSCTVELTVGDIFNKTFKVYQECETSIIVPFNPVTLNAAGESVDVLVQNNVYSWSATTDADWLTLKKKDSSTLTVTSVARSDSQAAPRKATVTIVNDYNEFTNTTFIVADADADLSGEDFGYGDHSDWD